MSITKLGDKELIKELRCLRMRLAADLNERNITILIEAEKRLAGGVTKPPDNIPQKKRKAALTKSEAYAKYYLK